MPSTQKHTEEDKWLMPQTYMFDHLGVIYVCLRFGHQAKDVSIKINEITK